MVRAYCEKEETLSYWFGGRLVAVKKAGTLSYVHQDHLGSSSLATDTTGATVSILTYFPYGPSRATGSEVMNAEIAEVKAPRPRQ